MQNAIVVSAVNKDGDIETTRFGGTTTINDMLNILYEEDGITEILGVGLIRIPNKQSIQKETINKQYEFTPKTKAKPILGRGINAVIC